MERERERGGEGQMPPRLAIEKRFPGGGGRGKGLKVGPFLIGRAFFFRLTRAGMVVRSMGLSREEEGGWGRWVGDGVDRYGFWILSGEGDRGGMRTGRRIIEIARSFLITKQLHACHQKILSFFTLLYFYFRSSFSSLHFMQHRLDFIA